MTICIAAISDMLTKSPKVVFCGDRLVSSNIEFEHGSPKILPIMKNVFVMLAGDPLQGTRIIQNTAKNSSKDAPTAVEDIAELLSIEYQRLEIRLTESEILVPLGLNRESLPNGLSLLPDWLQMSIYNQIKDYSLGVEFIIFGLDDTGAHIFTVTDRGRISCFDQLGFAVIGSGGEQANAELTRFLYSPMVPLSEVLLGNLCTMTL